MQWAAAIWMNFGEGDWWDDKQEGIQAKGYSLSLTTFQFSFSFI